MFEESFCYSSIICPKAKPTEKKISIRKQHKLFQPSEKHAKSCYFILNWKHKTVKKSIPYGFHSIVDDC